MTIFLLLIVVAGCFVQSCILLRLLVKERKKSAQLQAERDKALHSKRYNAEYYNRTVANLRGDLFATRQFASQVERFTNGRITDVECALKRANAIIEMLVEQAPVEEATNLTREEARRLFVT